MGTMLNARVPAAIDPQEPNIQAMTDQQLVEASRLINESTRPVIYAGGGIVISETSDRLIQLAERLDAGG